MAIQARQPAVGREVQRPLRRWPRNLRHGRWASAQVGAHRWSDRTQCPPDGDKGPKCDCPTSAYHVVRTEFAKRQRPIVRVEKLHQYRSVIPLNFVPPVRRVVSKKQRSVIRWILSQFSQITLAT